MKLVIDRTKWLRGEGYSVSKLLRSSDHKMCCIGFLCADLGIPESELLDVAGSHSQPFSCELPLWLAVRKDTESDLQQAYNINDEIFPDAEREQRLTEIFARHDVEVEFIN
jgi:hypothetical protein